MHVYKINLKTCAYMFFCLRSSTGVRLKPLQNGYHDGYRECFMALLTDRKAKALKPTDAAIPHGGIVGLNLHPLKTVGHGQWKLRYVSPTTRKRRAIGLGSYPAVSIADATQRGLEIREMLNQGEDPLEQTKHTVSTRVQIPTFSEAARLLHAELVPSWRNKKHGNDWMNSLEMYAFAMVGDTLVSELKPSHFADVLRPIWLEKKETAARVKQRCHAVMAWAWAHDHVAGNPLDVVNKLLPVQKPVVQHQPAMPWKLAPSFWKESLVGYPRGETTRPLLMFLILTATRSGEVRAARWKEIDLAKKVWTIPANRMKAGTQHRVPLSEQSVTILEGQLGLHEELVFPSPMGNVPSDMILTSFLRREKTQSDTEGRTATAHGFRSSFRDWASENGYRKDLAERALAHAVESKVEAAYHRTDLLEERRVMMQVWADFLAPSMLK